METPQPDKTGMHILLKLASLVVILAGIHAAADIIVQLLLALFFAIVLNPLVTWFIRRGVQRPRCHYDCSGGDADRTNRAGRRTGGIV
ncbi:inner membrane protein [Escherichia coli]|uniref:Inner membrane protein n=1 Tax=Escherichia coli TaxID=562 RepID=A0A376KJ98_ECOLX|nr:inner membrane protein [Escherichia coli]